jgi:hypothetical protein
VAALLNASHPNTSPPSGIDTPAEVIGAFQSAFDSGDYGATTKMFEAENESYCPLNGAKH